MTTTWGKVDGFGATAMVKQREGAGRRDNRGGWQHGWRAARQPVLAWALRAAAGLGAELTDHTHPLRVMSRTGHSNSAIRARRRKVSSLVLCPEW